MAALEKLFTIQQAAELLSIAPGTLTKWLSLGRIPRTRVGGCTRIRGSELAAFIQDGVCDEAQSARARQMGLSNRRKAAVHDTQ